ncbi:MAG TPA: hypothetical protein VE978_21365 [Chitinophagales bacterium]|nr:hypothetical protein [Chitinophagales bacterium]
MPTPLLKIQIPSIYPTDNPGLLPSRMAMCTPDTKNAVFAIASDVAAAGGKLVLTDMFRSYLMQLQSHNDFVSHKKTAFSPAPGGSLHEAGRAMDIDLNKIHVSLAQFWEIAQRHGFSPIIKAPTPGVSESWHFDCRGSHGIVYDYYTAGKGNNMKPYAAMAASAILSIGVSVDQFKGKERQALIQSALIRLGHDIGSIDGSIGNHTMSALQQEGITSTDVNSIVEALHQKLQQKFPGEYEIKSDDVTTHADNLFGVSEN